MTQQEIKEAIFDLSGDDRNPLNKPINLAKLHLSVMKSGMPKKKLTYQNRSIKIGGQEIKETDSRYNAGYNDGIKDFTAYLAQKLIGLEDVIRGSSLCHLCLSNVSEGEKEIKELVEIIRKHLEAER